MKLLAPLAALLLATLPLAASAADVSVHLDVNALKAGLPGWRSCDLVVPAGSNGGDVLDQAVSAGCILEWTSAEFQGFGRYVVSIDHVAEAIATFWAFSVNGESSNVGIDGYTAQPGDTIGFSYTEWLVPL